MNRLEVYDGNTWIELASSYASIELSQDAQDILEWARVKRDQEAKALEMAKTNAAVADALNAVQQAQEQLDIVVALTKVN
jgi:serine phosphatase RsbU (regulator of sigma subunit)